MNFYKLFKIELNYQKILIANNDENNLNKNEGFKEKKCFEKQTSIFFYIYIKNFCRKIYKMIIF